MFSKDKTKIAAIRAGKFAAYCIKHGIDPARVKCLCGRPAVGIKMNSPTCAVCLEIEERLSGHHGPVWAANPGRVQNSVYHANRQKRHEVGPFDPDINGMKVAYGY